MRPSVRAILGLVVTALALLSLPATASAQDSGSDGRDTLSVRSIDGRDADAVQVQFLFSGPREMIPDLVVRENGRIVPASEPVLVGDTEDYGIVLAIDTSGSMTENAAFERATDAARQFIANKQADDQIAIVSFNESVQVVQNFTADESSLLDAVGRLGLSGTTSLYDAVARSVNLFAGTDLVPNIVVVTDGRDSGSTTTDDIAAGLLAESGTLLFAIGIQSDDLDLRALDRLASATGGTVLTSADPAELDELYADVQQRLRRQYRVTFPSTVDTTGPVDIKMTVGNASADASYTPGSRLTSTAQIAPVVRSERSGISALQSNVFFWIGLLLVLAAVAAAVYAVATTLMREGEPLDSVLQPYSDGFVAPDEDADRMATSAILKRAVQLTGDFAERRGLLRRTEDMLERADLPLRAAEALFFHVVSAIVLGVIGSLLLGGVLGGAFIGVLALLIPPATVAYLAARRRKRFNQQLPDMLGLLASTLRAGYSLMQGVEAAAQEVADPIRKELQRVVTEARLGMPLEDAFDGVARRMASRDFEWATMAIGIQREVGGNLAEILDTVGQTMMARERLRRDISSLTAEGRISALVLGLLPIGIGLLILRDQPRLHGVAVRSHLRHHHARVVRTADGVRVLVDVQDHRHRGLRDDHATDPGSGGPRRCGRRRHGGDRPATRGARHHPYLAPPPRRLRHPGHP